MTNVSVEGPIVIFHEENTADVDVSVLSCADYLRRREAIERAAAKSSGTLAGRRAHQELAELIHAARKNIEKARTDQTSKKSAMRVQH